jgi:crotonobetainyl-CoA:carnitine CoA-transferase CaiB-like acyl-CoA transferase
MPAKKTPARGRGRPRLHAEEMTETIQIRCTASDRDQWAALAAEFELAVGPWLRMLAKREVKKASK